MSTLTRAAACGVGLAALVGCGSAPATAPSPRPPSPAPVASIDPCSLISSQEVSQATGTVYDDGTRVVVRGPSTVQSDGTGCGFVAVESARTPTPGPDGLTSIADGGVSVTLISRQNFDVAASAIRGIAESAHPITLPGADAAVELVGPDVGTVFARRGSVSFRVDVSRGKGADPAAEERIATVVLSHLR